MYIHIHVQVAPKLYIHVCTYRALLVKQWRRNHGGSGGWRPRKSWQVTIIYARTENTHHRPAQAIFAGEGQRFLEPP